MVFSINNQLSGVPKRWFSASILFHVAANCSISSEYSTPIKCIAHIKFYPAVSLVLCPFVASQSKLPYTVNKTVNTTTLAHCQSRLSELYIILVNVMCCLSSLKADSYPRVKQIYFKYPPRLSVLRQAALLDSIMRRRNIAGRHGT